MTGCQNSMKLFLDTVTDEGVRVGLVDPRFVSLSKWRTAKGTAGRAETIILLLQDLLGKTKQWQEKIDGIIVVQGPGGFSAVRAGVIAGNVLSFSLGAPIVGVRWITEDSSQDLLQKGLQKLKDKPLFFLKPYYDKSPSISSPSRAWH